MKRALLILSLMCSVAYSGEAQPTSPSLSTGNTAQQQQQQSSTSEAFNSGVSQEIVFTSPEQSTSKQEVHYSGSQTVKNVPSVGGPPLVSSNDTCMGSISGSVNFPGFGAGLGTTWNDENCKMLKNSRELWNMGMRAAALTRMCGDKDNREALELTGYVCAQTLRDKKLANEPKPQPHYTDPIIRDRLGLPSLK